MLVQIHDVETSKNGKKYAVTVTGQPMWLRKKDMKIEKGHWAHAEKDLQTKRYAADGKTLDDIPKEEQKMQIRIMTTFPDRDAAIKALVDFNRTDIDVQGELAKISREYGLDPVSAKAQESELL